MRGSAAKYKENVPIADVEAVFKCGEGKDWYITSNNPDTASLLSYQTITRSSGTTVKIESLER